MDITDFVVSGRDQALLYGGYGAYRAQVSKRLHSIRKRLGQTTKKGAKYTPKAPVTAVDIASNKEYVHLQLLAAERAWAHAMFMKDTHASDSKGITGSARSHIISRLSKASKTAKGLLDILADQTTTGASATDLLEARAYAASLAGAELFEKQNWEACVISYSVAWAIYSALTKSSKLEAYKDLLSGTIEPSIRYGAYQIRIPRTVAVPTIARKYFPRSDTELESAINDLDASILRDSVKVKASLADSEGAARTITWRSRTVELADASIAVPLASVEATTKTLVDGLSSNSSARPSARAALYDPVLIAIQDAVDATKHAIDELVAEGVSQADPRIQSLQITRTAVSYEMISWRVGRNRVLCGSRDGAVLESQVSQTHAKGAKTRNQERTGRKLARLREIAVLYDATLQSLDSIKELPGVAADTEFMREIDAKYNYFRALKCLAIARSHSLLSEYKNALALLARASDLISTGLPLLNTPTDHTASSPPNIVISSADAQFLNNLLQGEVQRHRALVEIQNITSKARSTATPGTSFPLVERLDTFPENGEVDLTNVVTYPPKLQPIPVKPIFLDIAWNYIDYPGRTPVKPVIDGDTPMQEAPASEGQPPPQQQKRGWFGFGR